MNQQSENDAIRLALLEAVSIETLKSPFRLFGRGHEPRVTLDRKLAAALRGVSIPCVNISGYGANNFYPYRVFITAVGLLNESLGWSPIAFSGSGSCYRVDRQQLLETERTCSMGAKEPGAQSRPQPPSDPMEAITAELKAAMRRKTPEIGADLAVLLATWATYIQPRNFSASTNDWHVDFLKWALRGRAKAFVDWANAQSSPEAVQALAGIKHVYDFRWPHNASCGYIFHVLWGWLQLELEKPGEKKPSSIAEQMENITRDLAAQGQRVKSWAHLGGGGVMAIPEDSEKTS